MSGEGELTALRIAVVVLGASTFGLFSIVMMQGAKLMHSRGRIRALKKWHRRARRSRWARRPCERCAFYEDLIEGLDEPLPHYWTNDRPK